ncbi:MAG TPA: S8 family serine peptidase, partial [Thermoanaerobaculia bacterium]|nr:S8 family serine peptidase [Thermoanaerobaculia bacterium]
MRLRASIILVLISAFPLFGGTFPDNAQTQKTQSITAFGSAGAVRSATQDGRIIEGVSSTTGELRLIVEFRDTPLFARDRRAALATGAPALKSLQARFAQFANDLQTIHADLARKVNASSVKPTASSVVVPRITHTFAGVYAGASVIISPDALEGVSHLDYVASVHLDREEHVYSTESDSKIGADQVWAQLGTQGKGIVVAVIDTGIDYNHVALGGGFGPAFRVIGGHDFVNDDDDPMDDYGHGTHVAGIIGGNGGGVVGVAPQVSFLAYKVLDSSGGGFDSTIMAGIERAADPNGDGNSSDHADVANMSLGRPGSPDDPVSKAVDTASAAGVVFAIAAGNSGDFYTISTPANAPSAIAVGATDLDDNIAAFSSEGPVDGTFAIKPEVVAPGVKIVSAKAGGGTLIASGTSMAAPHVAGVAALLRAIHHDWSVEDIKAAIVETAKVLGNDVMSEGAGRIDALAAATDDLIAEPSTLNMGLDNGSSTTFSATKHVALSNRSTHAVTLSVTATGSRSGLSAAVDQPSLSLGPGETKSVSVTIVAANDQIVSPTKGSLAFSGALTVTGGSVPIHVPWAMVKAATLTVTYDSANIFELFAASTSSTTLGHTISDVGNKSVDMTLPAGRYDIKVSEIALQRDSNHRFFVVEDQPLENTTTVNLAPAMASNEVLLNASDDRGLPLTGIGSGNGQCAQTIFLWFPSGSALTWSEVSASPNDHILLTPLSSRFTILPFERCVDFDHNAIYVADFPQMRGLNGTVPATLDASAWSKQNVRILAPAGSVNPITTLVPGIIWSGANFSYMDLFGTPFPLYGKAFDATLHLTPIQHPSMNGTGLFAVAVDPPPGTAVVTPNPLSHKIEAVQSPAARRLGNSIVFRTYVTPKPTDYITDPAETITFGDGLLHPETSIWLDTTGQLTTTYWYGAFGEIRDLEGANALLRILDGAGNVLRSARTFLPPYPPDAPGIYRLEETTPVISDGISGTATLESRFDTRLEDSAPPTFTAMRLQDGNGRSVSRLQPHSAGSLLFAAIDKVPIGDGGVNRALVRAEATTAQWKPHGSDTWRPLTCVIGTTDIANGQT